MHYENKSTKTFRRRGWCIKFVTHKWPLQHTKVHLWSYLVGLLPITFISFTKLTFRRSFWGDEQVWIGSKVMTQTANISISTPVANLMHHFILMPNAILDHFHSFLWFFLSTTLKYELFNTCLHEKRNFEFSSIFKPITTLYTIQLWRFEISRFPFHGSLFSLNQIRISDQTYFSAGLW